MRREHPEACLSDLLLDRMLAGERLHRSERMHAEAHLRSCSACAQRKEALEGDARAFDVPFRLPLPQPRRSFAWGLRLGFATAATAALFLVVRTDVPAPEVRSKGGGTLALIARSPDGTIERVLPGDSLAPGDAIRFEVRTSEPAVVAVLGIDAAGAVTPYVEEVAVDAGGPQVLPGAILLDETLGPERLVALFCSEPLGRAGLLEAGAEALERAGGDPAAELHLEAPGCLQTSLLIRKVARP